MVLLLSGIVAACMESPEGEPSAHRGLTLKELLLEDARACDSGFDYPQVLIDGLSRQLIEELRCMNSNWLEFYEPCEEVGCIYADGPQPLAARPEVLDALREAASSEGDFISIRAGYRDVAMQYYSRWYKENCNASFPAAVPGNSNHQGGRAVDVTYYDFWWDALLDAGFEHPIPNDEPHFELVGDRAFRNESEQLKSLGILAFQRLWNRQNPGDSIVEDGVYGPQTKDRLGDSPVEGFAVGTCSDDPPDPVDASDGPGDSVSDFTEDVEDRDGGPDGGDPGEDIGSDSDSSPDGIDAVADADVGEDGGNEMDARADATEDSGRPDGINREDTSRSIDENPYVDQVVFGGGGCAQAPSARKHSWTLAGLIFGVALWIRRKKSRLRDSSSLR